MDKLQKILIAVCLGIFAIFFHDPQGTISDDLRHTTIMEQFYLNGKLHLRNSGNPGINEMKGQDGRIYSASNLGPSLWYYPAFLAGKAFNHVAALPMEMRPRCNYVGKVTEDDFSENRQGDWGPVFARLANALLFPLSFLLLLQIAPASLWAGKFERYYPWAVLFGTQFLLLNHSNFDHNLNGFGLLLAIAAAAKARQSQWQKRWLLLSGIGLGLCITTRQFSIVYAPFLLVWFTWELWQASRMQRLIIVLLPTIAGVLINLIYNHLRSGSYFTTGYDPRWIQFQSPLAGLEMYGWSATQSVLLYSPVLLLSIPGIVLSIRSLRSDTFKTLLLCIALAHCGFYLVWKYVGGNLVPLRFLSEVFFIGVFFVPVARFQSVRLLVPLLCAWGFLVSIFLSFLDFRRLPEMPTTFTTWKTPRGLSGYFALADDTYKFIHDLNFALGTGTPDWLGYLLLGKMGLLIGSLLLALIALSLVLFMKQSGWKAHLPAFAPALALGIGSLLACPNFGSSNVKLSTRSSELQDIHLTERNGYLVFSGKLAVRESKVMNYCLRLQHKNLDFVRADYCAPFTFGAQYYKSSTLPVSRNRGELAAFTEFIPLAPSMPPGNYTAFVEVEGAQATVETSLPDTTPLVRHAQYIDSTRWVHSTNFNAGYPSPVIAKNSTAFMAFHLPFEPTSLCKGTIFVDDSQNCEIYCSLKEMKITGREEKLVKLEFPCPKSGNPVVLAVKTNQTSASLAGVQLEPKK